MIQKVVESYIQHLKVGFSLCKDADREKIERAFAPALVIAEKVREEDVKSVETVLLFLDYYPFLSVCGCSSIAQTNLYPDDTEAKTLGRYEVLSRVSLADHILGGLIRLGELFENMSDGSVFRKINEMRIELTAKDYFFLLVGYLYHDVGKSPQILNLVMDDIERYRKVDHVLAGGQLLLYLKHELTRHGVAVPDHLFRNIYLPVIEHHQKPTTPLSAVLKYVDHAEREDELRSFGLSGSLPLDLDAEEKENTKKDPQPRERSVPFQPLPSSLIEAFLYGVTHRLLPRRRQLSGRMFYTYIHFPPCVYVGSFHVKYLLLYITKKAGTVLPSLEEMDEMTASRLLIKKAREKGLIRDTLFQKDLLAGWWYEVKTRKGDKLYFFGFPLYIGATTRADPFIADIRPLTREEIEKLKKKNS